MKRMLMISVFSMVAAAGSASADPVTSDDLLKAQDNAGEWLTVRPRLSQLALQPA